MNFLARFLKVFIFALVLSALGALVFYWLVVSGSKLRTDVTSEEFSSTVKTAVGAWVGFITVLSSLLALTGMKQTISVPVYDRNIFLHRVNAAITSLRYRPSQQSDHLLVFKPLGVAVLAEKITVQLGQDSAAITAPRGLIRKLRERL
ncbi:MAG: hypothetical protein QOH25_2627 [Acidobacteriota bacterium]|jgi:hypothetical protein|nr:hypothetical protein [Acidobacteriota bacterium]